MLSALLLTSCNEDMKENYVSDFTSFVKGIEDQYATFDQVDWDKAEKRFDLYSKVKYKKYKKTLSEAQNEEINNLIGKYQALRIKSSIRTAAKTAGDILKQVGSTVNEIVNDTTINK